MDKVKTAEIIRSAVICKQPGRYIGWPTIAKTPDGQLLVAFSGDRDAHVDPFGKTMLVRSTDNGLTWGEEELINDTPLDDRDAGICACRDGTLVVSWFTSHYRNEVYLDRVSRNAPEDRLRWQKKLKTIGIDDIRRWSGERIAASGRYECGYWIRRSTDSGHSWQEPVRVPCSTPHGPIELADGRLIFVGAEINRKLLDRQGHILAAESCDQGKTWAVIGRINMYPEYLGPATDGYAYLCEPHVVETSPGRLLAMARYEELPRPENRSRSVLWQFSSEDGGRTWSDPQPTGILGKPPHLLKLRDGRILVTYGYRHEPYGERACISPDQGRTWQYDSEIILRDDAPSGDLGYPASIQLDDGSIVTVYYQQENKNEKTCLMTTHWKPIE